MVAWDRYQRQLRRLIAVEMNELFPAARVTIERCLQDSSGTITLVGVRFVDRGGGRELLWCERVEVRGALSVADWFQAGVRVEQVDLHGMRVTIWPTAEGDWSWDHLRPRVDPRRRPPTIQVHHGALHLLQSSAEGAPAVALHNLRGTFRPHAAVSAQPSAVGARTGITLRTDSEGPPKSETGQEVGGVNGGQVSPLGPAERWLPELIQLRERLAPQTAGPTVYQWNLQGRGAGWLDRIELVGSCEIGSERWEVAGRFQNLDFEVALLDRLPPNLVARVAQLRGLQGAVSGTFEMQSDGDTIRSRISGAVSAGALRDRRMPYPLEDLECQFSWIDGNIQLRNLRARSGAAAFEVNADLTGLSTRSPMIVLATVEHLPLDSRLYHALPASIREVWDRLELAGAVSGQVELQFDGHRWRPAVSLQCEAVSMRPWLFPYPLTDIRGNVTFRDDHAAGYDLSGRAGGQPVFGQFSLRRTGTQWTGRLACNTAGGVAIDERLMAALTPAGRLMSDAEAFVRSLNASGKVRVHRAEFYRQDVEDVWHRSIDLFVHDGKVAYDHFRYPIYNIRGRVIAQDDHWWLDGFEGSNDTGRIQCRGDWFASKQGCGPMQLQFHAYAVPVEEELKKALPSDAQFVWEELQPSGAIDEIHLVLTKSAAEASLGVVVEIREDRSTNAATGRSLRVRPKSFPYWLTDVDCRITYRPGEVVIEHAEGGNGPTRIALTGKCHPNAAGRWKAEVQWLPQTRLHVGSELLKALPQSIRETLVKAEFRGPVHVLGTSEITFANEENEQLETAWDCKMAIEDGQLADGTTVGAMRGTVWMRGVSNAATIRASGFLAMDALEFLGIPITRLNGPFAIVGSNLYFGSRVVDVLPPVDRQLATDLTAHALSGQVALSGHSRLDIGKLYLDGTLQGARLSLLLQDLGVLHSDVEAICDAEVHFAGVPWNPHTYDGNGRVALRDARLYQLPFMMRLLRAASVDPDDNTAFDTAEIRFAIDGDRIPLQVACEGDVLRLRGDGMTNLRREISLDLYSYVGRRLPGADALTPVLPDSRFATFMLIQVGGTLDNPTMQRKPFPQIEATFQQIFPELAEQRRRQPMLPWRR
ncbi:MAG: hypothetical protein KatS3mg111_0717 [Pirellulaceae bacterium]|nr:MAG: hypothetical protein KatS3mg111_0717 [Pirellulaceae bacterium]